MRFITADIGRGELANGSAAGRGHCSENNDRIIVQLERQANGKQKIND